MTAKLYCRTGEMAGAEFLIAQEAAIGSASDNAIVLPLPTISAHHARISFDAKKGAWFLEDLKSRNGTTIDGIPVMQQKEKLGTLNVITFAGVCDFIFQAEAAKPAIEPPKAPPPKKEAPAAVAPPPPAPPAPPPPAPPAPPPPAPPPPTPAPAAAAPPPPPPAVAKEPEPPPPPPTIPLPKPVLPDPNEHSSTEKVAMWKPTTKDLDMAPPPVPSAPKEAASAGALPLEKVCLVFENSNNVFELRNGENIVGRGKENAVFLDQGTMSRRHASITVYPDRVAVKDLGSTNGTFIEQRQVQAQSVVELRATAKIRFGKVEGLLVLKRIER